MQAGRATPRHFHRRSGGTGSVWSPTRPHGVAHGRSTSPETRVPERLVDPATGVHVELVPRLHEDRVAGVQAVDLAPTCRRECVQGGARAVSALQTRDASQRETGMGRSAPGAAAGVAVRPVEARRNSPGRAGSSLAATPSSGHLISSLPPSDSSTTWPHRMPMVSSRRPSYVSWVQEGETTSTDLSSRIMPSMPD